MRSNKIILDESDKKRYEVIERGEAIAPHPHPSQGGRLTAFAGVTRVLVTDEDGNARDGVECDECGRPYWAASGETEDLVKATQAARGHAASHSDNHGGPLYPKETIAKVIRLVKRAELTTGTRNKCVIAAEQLNREGVPTYRGDPWTGQTVSGLYNRWKDEIRVRVSVPKQQAPVTPVSPAAPSRKMSTRILLDGGGEVRTRELSPEELADNLMRAFAQATAAYHALTKALGEATPLFVRLQEQLNEVRKAAESATIDPELLEKARKYDALRGLMND